MIVLLLLAIMAATVVPMALDTSDFQTKAAAERVVADLAYAQNQAIVQQDPVTVTFSPETEIYTLSNASGPLVHPMTGGDYVVDFASSPGTGQVNLASADFDGEAAVTFDVLGAPNEAGSVTVQAGATSLSVSVAAVTGLTAIAE